MHRSNVTNTFAHEHLLPSNAINTSSQAHNALEIELWGAPDSKIDPQEEELLKKVVLYGREVEVDLLEDDHEEEELDDEVDIQYLTEQLDDTKHELKVQRDVVRQAKAEREKTEAEKNELKKQKESERSDLEAKIKSLEEKAKTDAETIKKLKSSVCEIM